MIVLCSSSLLAEVTFSINSCNLAFTSDMVSERSMCKKKVDFFLFTLMYTHLLVMSSPAYPSVACARHHVWASARTFSYLRQHSKML